MYALPDIGNRPLSERIGDVFGGGPVIVPLLAIYWMAEAGRFARV
jgi:hypothetical protein